ncbi:MAG: hypothetical protein AB1505_30990 [Candidatus Latescibacterota bacterium]
MTTNDALVAEIRAARERHAARFGFDLKAIIGDVRERQRASGRTYVTFPARRPAPAPTKA